MNKYKVGATSALILFSFGSVFSQVLSDAQRSEILSTSTLVDHADNSRWAFLKDELSNVRMVSIGEFSHGSRDVNLVKVDLIAWLHQEMGFDAILLESGIGEWIRTISMDSLNAREMMRGLTGPWRNDGHYSLMRYASENRLKIAGFDIQRTGRSFAPILEAVCTALQLDSSYYSGLEARFSQVSMLLRQPYDSIKDRVMDLSNDYERLSLKLSRQDGDNRPANFQLVERTLQNRIEYLDYRLQFAKEGDYRRRWFARDSAMAANVRWLVQEILPDRKIIILAHNFHVAKFNDKEEVMGEWLEKWYGEAYFPIGMFAGKGQYANNSGKPVPLSSPDSTRIDIKEIILALPGEVNYVNADALGSVQLYGQPVVVNDSFIDLDGTNVLVLSDHFEGLILISDSTLPLTEY